MEKKKEHTEKLILKADTAKKAGPDGYPAYPVSEDIYNKSKEEENINPENISTLKEPNEDDKTATDIDNKKGIDEDEYGGDLDVPGAELDDEQEAIGSEDEENNYYSLGGDNHNELDENRD